MSFKKPASPLMIPPHHGLCLLSTFHPESPQTHPLPPRHQIRRSALEEGEILVVEGQTVRGRTHPTKSTT